MAEKTRVVDAATGETVPVAPEPSGKAKSHKVTVSLWVPIDPNDGKSRPSMEQLKHDAIVNTRDAVPVQSYDPPDFEVVGTKPGQKDNVPGVWWECQLTYVPGVAKPEPVDLERVIKEARAAALGTPPGAPDFLEPA